MRNLTLVLLLACTIASTSAAPCSAPNWTCLAGTKSFCRGGKVFTCPTGTRCSTPPAPVRRSPCVGTATNPVCPFGDFICNDKFSYCHGGELFACPAGTRCIGKAPCVGTATFGGCPGGEYACQSISTFCSGGQITKCPTGTKCVGFAPCVMA